MTFYNYQGIWHDTIKDEALTQNACEPLLDDLAHVLYQHNFKQTTPNTWVHVQLRLEITIQCTLV